ncbi:MAG: glycoside hydrolase family 2 TIM barrel-domain containing protein [Pontiellaceae bacterium]
MGENVIAVRADNTNDPDYPPGKPQEQLDFTYFGGIYRDAWLIAHNEVYVTHPVAAEKVAGGGVFIHSEDVSEAFACMITQMDIANVGQKKSVDVRLELKDRTGRLAAHAETFVELNDQTGRSVKLELDVDSPMLWSPDDPHLYDLFVTIQSTTGDVLDAFRKRVGIRSIELRGRKGFFLNGKRYPEVLIGANRHQDFAHIGNALPNNLHWRDAVKLRQAGMRVIRSAHYIQDPAFMDACDALGLFMVTTIPGWQFWNEEPIFMERMLEDVRKLVRLERNRPSMLLWEVIPNETHFPATYAEQATAAAQEEYPFLGFYTATDSRTDRVQSQDLFDVLYADDTVWSHKEKSVFKREWGDFVDNWVDHNSVSRVAKQWGEEPQIRQAMHYFCEEWVDAGQEKSWPSLTKVYTASPALVGATLWHSFDHQRGYHPDPFWGGIMDAYRQPKFSYFLFKSLLPTEGLKQVPLVEAKPFIYIAHLMTPFSPADVTVFTNCEEVRLTLFDKEIGVKPAIVESSPVPRVPVVFKNVFRYVDVRNQNKKGYGKINQQWVESALMKAEGLINGEVVAEQVRWPVGRKRRLVLSVDDTGTQPIADGSDITPVVAHLVDAGGGIKRMSHEYIRFHVSGAGALIEEVDLGMNPQKLLWGEAVALVRSGIQSGVVRVEAEVICDSLNGPDRAVIEFETVAPRQKLLFNQQAKQSTPSRIETVLDESETVQALRRKLRETERSLQDYKLMEVGRQQQEFIQ